MKIQIEGHAWLPKSELSAENIEWLKNNLTFKQKISKEYEKRSKGATVQVWAEEPDRFGVPREFFFDKITKAHEVEYRVSRGEAWPVRLTPEEASAQREKFELPLITDEWIAHRGESDGELAFYDVNGNRPVVLREQQVGAVESALSHFELRPANGGLIQAPTGFGKTMLSLAIMRKLKMRTAVLVHREFVLNQWKKKILQYMPDAKIGIVMGDKYEVDGCHVVLVMIQTIASWVKKKKVPVELSGMFGLTVHEEVHRGAAPYWSAAIPVFNPSYRIGISAAPRRSDGLDKVFFYHIGPKIFTGTEILRMPKIRRVWSNFKLNHPRFNPSMMSMEFAFKLMSANPIYNQDIIDQIKLAIKAGRKIFVYSHTVKHLQLLKSELDSQWKETKITTDFYIGGMSEDDLDVAAEADVIFGCVTDDVECLTEDGWKKNHELIVGEKVASYNMRTKEVEYTELVDVCRYDYNGIICRSDRKHFNVRMTWNHRNIIERADGSNEIVTASGLKRRHKILVSAPVRYEYSTSIGEDMAELIGWVIAEGHYVPAGNGKGVVISQNEGPYAVRIDALLKSTGIIADRREYRPGEITWYVNGGEEIKIKAICEDKLLSKNLVSLPPNELQALFNGLMRGDGHFKPDGRMTFIQKNKITVDWFCVLAMRLGWRVLVGNKGNQVLDKESGGVTYRVYLTKRTTVGLSDRKFHISGEPYKGIVWCPKTNNDTWVARSNGAIFITGNTFQMAKDSLDIPALDTIVLAGPIRNPQQPAGRACRDHPTKKDPVVVDMRADSVPVFKDYAESRDKAYERIYGDDFLKKKTG